MLKTTIALLTVAPMALFAQTSARASAHASSSTQASVGRTEAGVNTSTSVDAEIEIARKRNLPERPIRRRAAEGRVKGATEAQVALAARQARLSLEAAHDAMVRAGRERPSDEEVERGCHMLARGYTEAQIEAVVKSAPSDRSLVVAFDVLSRLQERGVGTARALAEVTSKLDARADDTSISALADARATTRLGAGASQVAGGAAGAARGTANVAGSAASATGSVSGAVSGVLKKP